MKIIVCKIPFLAKACVTGFRTACAAAAGADAGARGASSRWEQRSAARSAMLELVFGSMIVMCGDRKKDKIVLGPFSMPWKKKVRPFTPKAADTTKDDDSKPADPTVVDDSKSSDPAAPGTAGSPGPRPSDQVSNWRDRTAGDQQQTTYSAFGKSSGKKGAGKKDGGKGKGKF